VLICVCVCVCVCVRVGMCVYICVFAIERRGGERAIDAQKTTITIRVQRIGLLKFEKTLHLLTHTLTHTYTHTYTHIHRHITAF
jgi:hypothetical protein